MSTATLLIAHPACLEHQTPMGHPERSDRLRAIEQALEDEKFQILAREQAPMAPAETIALCHPIDYVEAIRNASPDRGVIHLDADTAMSPGSLEAALRAAGGGVKAVDEVMGGTAANAFVTVRPPGHHAETARPTTHRSSTAPSASRSSISTCTTATARRTSSGPTSR
jgi:acetoin utilization deacetylase AcuC-like enzyme